jgi:hypothetical protein
LFHFSNLSYSRHTKNARERGPPGPSDADIGAKGLPGIKWPVKEKVKLAGALEEFFGGLRVDLVCLSDADPFLAAEIIRGERLFAGDGDGADGTVQNIS